MRTTLESSYIFVYLEVLIGDRQEYGDVLKGSESEKKAAVASIWKYAVEELLGWTPEEAAVYMDHDTVKMLKLEPTLAAVGIDKKDFLPDYRPVLKYAFPDKIRYDERAQTIDIYERTAHFGIYANDPENKKFPKGFWSDSKGIQRTNTVMNYVVNRFLSGFSPEERYDLFADTNRAKTWLKDKKLDKAWDFHYENPLDYYHFSMPDSDPTKSDLLYYAAKLDNMYKKAISL